MENPVSTVRARPGGLTVICILAIVLGATGALFAIATVAGFFFEEKTSLDRLLPWATPNAAEGQQAFAAELNDFARQHVVRNWFFESAHLFTSLFLTIGGILSLKLRPSGQNILLVAFVIAMIFEGVQTWPSLEGVSAIKRAFQRMMDVQEQQMKGRGQDASDLQEAGQILEKVIGIALILKIMGLVLAKTGLYGFSLWYLTRPRVAGLFVRPKPVDPQWA